MNREWSQKNEPQDKAKLEDQNPRMRAIDDDNSKGCAAEFNPHAALKLAAKT